MGNRNTREAHKIRASLGWLLRLAFPLQGDFLLPLQVLGVHIGLALLVGQGGAAGHDALALVIFAELHFDEYQPVLGAIAQRQIALLPLAQIKLSNLQALAAQGAGRL